MAEENILIEKLLDILDQKNTKLLPQNLRDKVRLLGVTGTLEQKEDLSVELQEQIDTIAAQREMIDTLFDAIDGKIDPDNLDYEFEQQDNAIRHANTLIEEIFLELQAK